MELQNTLYLVCRWCNRGESEFCKEDCEILTEMPAAMKMDKYERNNEENNQQ